MIDRTIPATPQARGHRRQATALAAVSLSSLTVALSLALATAPEVVHAQEAATQISIQQESLSDALLQLGQQTSLQFIYTSDLVRGLTAKPIRGVMTAEEALRRLLAGTGIQYSRSKNTIHLWKTGEATQLAPVTVAGSYDGGVTEGTGSYTAGRMATALGVPLSIRETPQSVSVVTRQLIDDKNLVSLDQALRDAPGIIATQDMLDDRWRYLARGSNVTNIMYDGVAMTPYRDSLSSDDLIIYDRVEITRGATGLMEGAGYPSASVNMVRKRPLDEARYSVNASASSYGNGRVELDGSQVLNEAGTLRGRFAGAFNAGKLYRDFNRTRNHTLYGMIEADLAENTTVSLGLTHQKQRLDGYSIGGLPAQPDGAFYDWTASTFLGDAWQYKDARQTTAYLDVEHRFGNNWRATLSGQRIWASSDILSSYLSYWSSAYTKYDSYWQNAQDSYSFSGQVSGPITLFGREHDLNFGISGRKDKINFMSESGQASIIDIFNWNPGASAAPLLSSYAYPYQTTYSTKETGIYGSGRFRLSDPLSVIIGGRLAWYDYERLTPSPSRYGEDRVFIPYVGAVYDVSDQFSLYGSYTSIFRAQSVVDAYGSPLPPVEGTNWEFGLKMSSPGGRLNASVAWFQTDQNNLPESLPINACLVSASCSRPSEKVRSRGVELELAGMITDQWNVVASYTYAKPEYVEGVKTGSRYNSDTYPEQMFKLFTAYGFDGQLSGLTIGGGVRAFSKTYSVGSTFYVEQPAYAVADALMRYQFNPNTALQLNINNVFNKHYYNAISPATNVGFGNVIGAPREFRLNLSHVF